MATPRWKEKIRPANFRGIRFFVDSSNHGGGRRGPDHEFPDRDDPYAADTGRRQRKYDVEAYIHGSDYLSQKKLLIEALEKEGPGALVHPYYGRVNVLARDFNVFESTRDGGYCRFTIKFVEAGQLLYPTHADNSNALVDLAGSVLGASARDAIVSGLNAVDQATFVVDDVTNKINDFADKLDDATAKLSAPANSIADLAAAIRNIKSSVATLILTPGVLFDKMQNAFGLLFDALDPSDIFGASKKMFSFGESDTAIAETTSSRQQQAANRLAINSTVQLLAVSAAASAATQMTHASVEDAVGVRDAILDRIDTLSESSIDDQVYSDLQNLAAQVSKAVPGNTENLASIAEVTLPSTMPSLVICYDLYGSLDQEQDIIDRNKIAHPGFVAGGSALEVLDRG